MPCCSSAFVTLFLPGWARISGAALKALLFGPDGPGPDWMWTGLTFVSVALVLFGPKVMYRAVERITIGLVVFMTLGLIFVAFQVGTLDAVGEMARGLLKFRPYRTGRRVSLQPFFWRGGVCRGRRSRQPVVRLLSAR